MADLTEKQLQLKEDTARCILNVANKVIPGTYTYVLKLEQNLFTKFLDAGIQDLSTRIRVLQ